MSAADNVGDAAFRLRQSYQSGFDDRCQLTIARSFCRIKHLPLAAGASRFIQSLNQPRRLLSKSFLAAMLDAPDWRQVTGP